VALVIKRNLPATNIRLIDQSACQIMTEMNTNMAAVVAILDKQWHWSLKGTFL
jgi:hypothetical protein